MRSASLTAVLAIAAWATPTALGATAPTIVLDPQSGPPGSFVTVSGRGFCGSGDCSRVTIQIYGVHVATDVRPSRSGAFSRRVQIPGGPSGGAVGVIAMQELADGSELTGFAEFEIVIRSPPPTTTATTPPTTTTTSTTPPRPPPTTTTRPETSPPPTTKPAPTSPPPNSTAPPTTDEPAGEAAPSAGTTGRPRWWWLAAGGALALLGIGAALAARLGRRGG